MDNKKKVRELIYTTFLVFLVSNSEFPCPLPLKPFQMEGHIT